MEIWQIILIVFGSIIGLALLLFILTFVVYITNFDSKMLAGVQKLLNKHYDKRKRNKHLE